MSQVSVNVNALLNSENLELPSGLVLTATRTAQGGDRDTLALTFEVIVILYHLFLIGVLIALQTITFT
jgi:hypothetical protein